MEAVDASDGTVVAEVCSESDECADSEMHSGVDRPTVVPVVKVFVEWR